MKQYMVERNTGCSVARNFSLPTPVKHALFYAQACRRGIFLLLYFIRLGQYKYSDAWNCHKSFLWVVVGSGVESKFSVSFGPIGPGLQL